MKVTLNIPDARYRVLVAAADERGVQVHTMFETAIVKELQPEPDVIKALAQLSRTVAAMGRALEQLVNTEPATIDPAVFDGIDSKLDVLLAREPEMPILPEGIVPRTHENLMTLYKFGLSDVKIAHRVDSSPQTIARWRRQNELPVNAVVKGPVPAAPARRRIRPEDLQRIRKLAADGWSDSQIAAEIGFSKPTVRAWRARALVAPGSSVVMGRPISTELAAAVAEVSEMKKRKRNTERTGIAA